MTAEKNATTVRRWLEEAWNNGAIERQAHIFSPAYDWAELPPPYGKGADGLFRFVQAFRAAFPDLHWALQDLIAADDAVAWRVRATGTQRNEFMGIPATGKTFTCEAIIISRFEDGLWREDHVAWDQLGMLQQLGVIPALEPATA